MNKVDEQNGMEMGVIGKSSNAPVNAVDSKKPIIPFGLFASIRAALADPELESTLRSVSVIAMLSDKTHVSASVLVFGTASVFALSLLISIAGLTMNVLVDLLGFVYPVYASYKAIASDDKADDKQWLTYWVVFGFLKVIEEIFFLNHIIPFYSMIKLVFLWYCAFKNGAYTVYKNVIEPAIKPYEARIDENLSKLQLKAQETEQNVVSQIAGQAGNIARVQLISSAVLQQ